MIKIVQEGAKKFTAVCPICGCQYAYELEDLESRLSGKYTKCPCCKEYIKHVGFEKVADLFANSTEEKRVNECKKPVKKGDSYPDDPWPFVDELDKDIDEIFDINNDKESIPANPFGESSDGLVK